jgi:hypothetical protein
VAAAATRDRNFLRGSRAIAAELRTLWPSMFDALRAQVRDRRPDVLISDMV